MQSIEHGIKYWSLVMDRTYFYNNSKRLHRMFQGWHYSCVKLDSIINLTVWKD